jgi:hypothetical protein
MFKICEGKRQKSKGKRYRIKIKRSHKKSFIFSLVLLTFALSRLSPSSQKPSASGGFLKDDFLFSS